MMRVINQEETRAIAEAQFHLHGAGKKDEKYSRFLQRVGYQLTTPVASEVAAASRDRTIGSVKRRLGRFYRPPIKA